MTPPHYTESSRDYYLGIDLGGSSVKTGIVTADGRIVHQGWFPLETRLGRDEGLKKIFDNVDHFVTDSVGWRHVEAIGMAAPGTMDHERGIIFHPFNLPGWENLSLRSLVAQRFQRPAVLENDANAAAYGEYWAGAGQGASSLMCWTLGTGVGGGLVLDGKLWRGAHFHAGEAGHIIIQKDDGAHSPHGIHGALELYAGGAAMVRRFQTHLDSGRSTMLTQGDGPITPKQIGAAAECGDTLALELVGEVAHALAVGTIGVIHLLNPELILIGGAMNFGGPTTEFGRQFLSDVRLRVKALALPIPGSYTRIEFAALGNAAGFVGAAGCARSALEGDYSQRTVHSRLGQAH